MREKLYLYLRKNIISIVLFTIFIVFMDIFIVLPISDQCHRRKIQLKNIKSEMDKYSLKLSKLENIRDNILDLSTNSIDILSKFNPKDSVCNIIDSVTTLLIKNKINFRTIEITQSGVTDLPILFSKMNIEFSTTEDRFINLLRKIRLLHTFTFIDSFSIKFEGRKISGILSINSPIFINGEMESR